MKTLPFATRGAIVMEYEETSPGFRFGDRPRRPEQLSGRGIESLHASVDDRDKHLAFIQRDAAAVDAAAKPRFARLRSSCDPPADR